MKLKVFKYGLSLTPQQSISMPKGAEFLSVQIQHKGIQMWFLVDETVKEKEIRHFEIAGTGNAMIHTDGKFLGTVQLADGMYVFHVFEIESKRGPA